MEDSVIEKSVKDAGDDIREVLEARLAQIVKDLRESWNACLANGQAPKAKIGVSVLLEFSAYEIDREVSVSSGPPKRKFTKSGTTVDESAQPGLPLGTGSDGAPTGGKGTAEMKRLARKLVDSGVKIEVHSTSGSNSGWEVDEAWLVAAAELVVERQTASTSLLQRELRIGWGPATRLLEALEKRHIVGPQIGTDAARAVLCPGLGTLRAVYGIGGKKEGEGEGEKNSNMDGEDGQDGSGEGDAEGQSFAEWSEAAVNKAAAGIGLELVHDDEGEAADAAEGS